ncbi:hypothetical protein BD413DRAFT_679174 [Trametes elegans]|nr:hypothetical protein BD413DRAFT_679174 [Trametes elegans]
MLVHQSTMFPWRGQVAKITKLERVKKTNFVPRWTISIMQYLANEGWGEKVDKLSVDRERELRKLVLTDDPAALRLCSRHVSEWTAIRPKVIAKMTELRAARLAEERSSAIIGRLYSLRGAVRSYDESRGLRSAPSDIRAEVADLVLVSALYQVIDAPADDADVMSEKAESEMLAERLPHAQDQ